MSSPRVASRYALAILDSRPEDLPLDTLLQDLMDVRASVTASSELRQFFKSPIISRKHKTDGTSTLFDGKVSPFTVGALLLLVENNRENLILEIIDAVFDLHRKREGIVASRIVSAVELSEEERGRLIAALRKLSGKNIEAEYATDPAIMGGVIVRLDDRIFDGSVRRQLQRLRTRFISGS